MEQNKDDQFQLLPLNAIIPDPDQPRKEFKEDDIAELATSIKHIGLIQPIVVRSPDNNGNYRIVVGERRYRAAASLEMREMPVVIRSYSDDDAYLEAQLAENLHGYRTGLEIKDRALALKKFMERFPTKELAAERLGKTVTWLNQMVEILDLPDEVRVLQDKGMVRDRVSLIGLKRLVEKSPEAAQELIQKASSGKKLTRAEVSSRLAPFTRKKQPKAGEQSALSLDPAPTVTESSPPALSKETSVSAPISETSNDGTIHSEPLAASQLDAEERSVTPRKPRNREKYSKVAKLLGMMEDADPELMLEKLMDEYLSLKGLAA